MIRNIKIVKVNSDYCDYLRTFDHRVMYNKNEKELRPFIGVLFEVNDCEYFAPLSSPKKKHLTMKNTVDFLQIAKGELGAINFNNMIPVKPQNYVLVDLNKKTYNPYEIKYQTLLKNQLSWLNSHQEELENKAYKLYNLYLNKKLPESIMDRCCNFILLEEKSKLYEQ